jgi:hypothetical protein
MQIRIILIVLITLSLSGAISSIVAFSMQADAIRFDLVLMSIAIIAVSLVCALYLYRKTKNSKLEWLLFGFLGNVNAIIVFHINEYVKNRWTKGKSILSD